MLAGKGERAEKVIIRVPGILGMVTQKVCAGSFIIERDNTMERQVGSDLNANMSSTWFLGRVTDIGGPRHDQVRQSPSFPPYPSKSGLILDSLLSFIE